MKNIKKSFIREILKVAQNDKVISFAGGLPNARLFPVKKIQAASNKVLTNHGKNALQYSTTQGFLPLREYIANRYNTVCALNVSPDEILIVNGSQQALDLLGKVFLNKGDYVVLERPGYLGAIQAFSMFEPVFKSIPLESDGIDIDLLRKYMNSNKPKIFYTVPNFQNPSGISYSLEKREQTANIIKQTDTVIIEDDPYRELRFTGKKQPTIASFMDNKSVLLGSFSKIIAPGLRMGWIRANPEIIDKLITVKQAADLHSNNLSQRIIHQYLTDNDIDTHIKLISKTYSYQKDVMIDAIKRYFPKEVKYTTPEGGMFLWITLPDKMDSMTLFNKTVEKNVVFVPGLPFYTDVIENNTFRMNFSNSDEDRIIEGIKRIGEVIEKLQTDI